MFNKRLGKKASHFLNATEAIFMIVLIGSAILMILLSGKINLLNIPDEVTNVEFDYLSTQALRTLAQSPIKIPLEVISYDENNIKIEYEEILFAEALNEYAKMKLSDDRSVPFILKRNAYLGVLSNFVNKGFGDYMTSNEAILLEIHFQDELLSTTKIFQGKHKAELGNPDDGIDMFIESEHKEQYVILPALLDQKYERAGDYELKLVFDAELYELEKII